MAEFAAIAGPTGTACRIIECCVATVAAELQGFRGLSKVSHIGMATAAGKTAVFTPARFCVNSCRAVAPWGLDVTVTVGGAGHGS